VTIKEALEVAEIFLESRRTGATMPSFAVDPL
jgi:hypothetical protein